ncbi:MAG: tetratricopeptide repeat protein [Bacteroidia bacterium]|nr:tetratricopeptide repeat protein [Bacteroidia bacterium]
MKKSIGIFVLAALLFSSCGNDESHKENTTLEPIETRKLLIDKIKKIESELYVAQTLDAIKADMAISIYSEFISKFPSDSLTPDFIFKAGEIATANMQYKQALGYYKNIVKNYTAYKYYVDCLYLQAHIFDNYLNNDDSAKVIYEKVIKEYPQSHYANDAKAAIQHLGKSDEQLIEEFKKKNKTN